MSTVVIYINEKMYKSFLPLPLVAVVCSSCPKGIGSLVCCLLFRSRVAEQRLIDKANEAEAQRMQKRRRLRKMNSETIDLDEEEAWPGLGEMQSTIKKWRRFNMLGFGESLFLVETQAFLCVNLVLDPIYPCNSQAGNLTRTLSKGASNVCSRENGLAIIFGMP